MKRAQINVLGTLIVCLGPLVASTALAQTSAQDHTPSYVLLDRAEPLHQAPRVRSATWRDHSFDPSDPDEVPYWAWRFRGARDGWVEVESEWASAVHSHCVDIQTYGLGGMALRFFVPASTLVPVSARAMKITHPDGSSMSLSAGVPLRPKGQDRYEVWTRHFTIPMTLDKEGAVASRYQRDRPVFLGLQQHNSKLPPWDRSAVHTVGGQAVAISRPGWGVKPDEIIRKGAVTFVTAYTDCMYIKAKVVLKDDSPYNRPVSSSGGGGGYGTGRIAGPARKVSQVRAGATVYWSNGRRAGVSLHKHTLDQKAWKAGQRLCAGFHLREPDESKKRVKRQPLCFDPRDVTTVDELSGGQSFGQIFSMHQKPPFPEAPAHGVTFGTHKVLSGQISSDLTSRLKRSRDALNLCHFSLRKKPTSKGRLTVLFDIDTRGHLSVKEVRGDTLAEPEVTSCITEHLGRLYTLPAPSKPVSVAQTLVFDN